LEIANPIYDVVFKYLMEDNRAAKLFLSAVIGRDIIDLEFLPQELTGEKMKSDEKPIISALNLSVYRLDFSAKVRDLDGSETVIIIEIQKSKFANEGMRFRKYLGKQYMNDSFFRWVVETTGRKIKTGIPILPVYILGELMIGFEDTPVIQINRCIRDRYTQEVIGEGSHFIDSLFHEGVIIHIPAINSRRRRDELEALLSIFDQDNRQGNHHIMNVKEIDFPEKFRPIIRRLQAAIQKEEMRDIMTIEDDFIAELNDYEHRIAEANTQKEEALQKHEEALQKHEEALQKQEEAVRLLLNMGMPADEIAAKLGLDLDYVSRLA
jgi:predicted RNase H-like HicB family nuclease